LEDSEALPSFLVPRLHSGVPCLGDSLGRELSERKKDLESISIFSCPFLRMAVQKPTGFWTFFQKNSDALDIKYQM